MAASRDAEPTHQGRNEQREVTLAELQKRNTALADKLIDHLFTPGVYLGPVSQRARAFRPDGSGISYLVGLTNHSHSTTAEAFRTAKDYRDRLMIVLLPEPGEEGYDLQERTADHRLLNLKVSRLVDGRHLAVPYPDFPHALEERETLRLRKYGELLTDVVKVFGLEDTSSPTNP